MATRKSKFDRILNDPLRKSLVQIAFELGYYSIQERRFAKEYLSRLLYRKNSLPFNNFLRDEEIGKLQLSRILHSDESAETLINKVKFYEFCVQNNIPTPKIIVYNEKQLFHDFKQAFEIKDVETFKELAKEWIFASKHQSIFIKPVDGKGGANAYRLDLNSNEVEFNTVFNAIITAHYIIQETIIQHPDIQMVSPYSINTLRVDTYKPLNEPSRVMSALMRFGRKGFVVDNPGSSGGFFVPVDMQNKCLRAPGLQMMAVGNHTYLEHPDTHVILDKHSIPYLDEAFALVNHACELLGDRLIGWDVCIGPEGPIIIEGNHNYHMVMQEVAYGGYRKHPDFIRVLAEENIRP